MITLKRLQWSNCFSYGPDNELNLDDNTVTQIIGTNGMGKSSIPLIIEEALFNKNSKGIKKTDIPNRYLNDGYKITLDFTKDEDSYTIRVARKSNIKVVFEKNGEDISSHTATNTYKSIQEVVGIDFKTFAQLVYQSTNSSLQFLTATDTNRKKFLIDLLHLENYLELFEVFKEAARASSGTVSVVKAKIATVEKWLNDNKLSDTTILPMLNLSFETEEDEKVLRQLTKEIENISEKNKKIQTNNKYKELLNTINLDSLESTEGLETKSYDKLQSQLGGLKGAAAGSKQLLNKLKGLGDHCPTCEQTVDAEFVSNLIEIESEKIEKARQQHETIVSEIEKIKEDNLKIQRREKAQRDWEDLFRSIDQNLPSKSLEESKLQEELTEVRSRLDAVKADIERVNKENQSRTRKNTRIQVILEQTDDFINQLEESTKELNAAEESLSNLEVLKKAFSTNGLIAYKIENLVKELEELTNYYLAELSDGRFTLEFVVSNDKLNVQITDNGNIVDILALSSGEQARVNTATLIAIRKLMSSISKSRINLLFLDEVINVLDDMGREKLVEVLLKEDLHTYIVSHGWAHPLLEKLEVIKCDNVSKLEH
jgi:DNA repair exonuclease SbcCD ATPase subunit